MVFNSFSGFEKEYVERCGRKQVVILQIRKYFLVANLLTSECNENGWVSLSCMLLIVLTIVLVASFSERNELF